MIVQKYDVKITCRENDRRFIVLASQFDQLFTERFGLITPIRNDMNALDEPRSDTRRIRIAYQPMDIDTISIHISSDTDPGIVRVHYKYWWKCNRVFHVSGCPVELGDRFRIDVHDLVAHMIPPVGSGV